MGDNHRFEYGLPQHCWTVIHLSCVPKFSLGENMSILDCLWACAMHLTFSRRKWQNSCKILISAEPTLMMSWFLKWFL
jgi:hypothetical protein